VYIGGGILWRSWGETLKSVHFTVLVVIIIIMCDDDNNRDETCVTRVVQNLLYLVWRKRVEFFCHHGFVR
jgi:hypothetical protein